MALNVLRQIKTINGKILSGTLTSSGSDVIHTGMTYCTSVSIVPVGTSAATSFPVIDTTLPAEAVTIVATSGTLYSATFFGY